MLENIGYRSARNIEIIFAWLMRDAQAVDGETCGEKTSRRNTENNNIMHAYARPYAADERIVIAHCRIEYGCAECARMGVRYINILPLTPHRRYRESRTG